MKAYFHLPGLFEFYDLYSVFLPLFREHGEYFFDWCDIGSIYGALADCLWGGGRVGFGDADPEKVYDLMNEYGISARLTFSNSLLEEKHLSDRKCNMLCSLFEKGSSRRNGVIICSDLLMSYIGNNYPELYFVSSTTKVLREFNQFKDELNRVILMKTKENGEPLAGCVFGLYNAKGAKIMEATSARVALLPGRKVPSV